MDKIITQIWAHYYYTKLTTNSLVKSRDLKYRLVDPF